MVVIQFQYGFDVVKVKINMIAVRLNHGLLKINIGFEDTPLYPIYMSFNMSK